MIFLKLSFPKKNVFSTFSNVLEGLGSSGRPVGLISTDPDSSPTPWSRVMTKNPGGGNFFFRLRYQCTAKRDTSNKHVYNIISYTCLLSNCLFGSEPYFFSQTWAIRLGLLATNSVGSSPCNA